MNNSQNFESYLPVYDTVPETWQEGRQFLVEQLKKISNAVNTREIGWFLDEELLSGQQFIPSSNSADSQQYRSIFRKVIDFSPLTIGANSRPHNINFNSNFTLMHLYAAATDSMLLTAIPIPNAVDTLDMDATNVNINSSAAYERAFAVIEYIQEV